MSLTNALPVTDDRRDSSVSVTSDLSLTSFQDFVENFVPPYNRDFGQFSTSYLCTSVQFPRIICEDSESCPDIEWRFPSQPVVETKFALQEKARRTLGPSVRKPLIIPSAKWILRDWEIKQEERQFKNNGERLKYLQDKARQFCQVSKALRFDEEYPKPDPEVIRKTYSETHQRAGKQVREKKLMQNEKLVAPGELQKIQEPFGNDPSQDGGVNVTYVATGQCGADVGEEDRERWREWERSVGEILGPQDPISVPSTQLNFWQQKALKTSSIVPKPPKKRFWKRNTYPPMTLEDKIAAKRRLLPPIKPEHLQTDQLSGIWVPELMVDKFEITPFNYDARVHDQGKEEPRPISWWVTHEATQKCWKWLKSIPDTL